MDKILQILNINVMNLLQLYRASVIPIKNYVRFLSLEEADKYIWKQNYKITKKVLKNKKLGYLLVAQINTHLTEIEMVSYLCKGIINRLMEQNRVKLWVLFSRVYNFISMSIPTQAHPDSDQLISLMSQGRETTEDPSKEVCKGKFNCWLLSFQGSKSQH